jgi:hypothetical protein
LMSEKLWTWAFCCILFLSICGNSIVLWIILGKLTTTAHSHTEGGRGEQKLQATQSQAWDGRHCVYV